MELGNVEIKYVLEMCLSALKCADETRKLIDSELMSLYGVIQTNRDMIQETLDKLEQEDE